MTILSDEQPLGERLLAFCRIDEDGILAALDPQLGARRCWRRLRDERLITALKHRTLGKDPSIVMGGEGPALTTLMVTPARA